MILEANLNTALSKYSDNSPEKIAFLNRHPSSLHMMKVLAPNPNLTGELFEISKACWLLGLGLFQVLPDGPELTAGLRKLVEAKDCFVRAALDAEPVDYKDR